MKSTKRDEVLELLQEHRADLVHLGAKSLAVFGSVARDYRLYLDDIETSCTKILEYTKGMTFDGFVQDAKSFDAVVFNLEVIGEAAKHIPESMRVRYPDADWQRIAGLRDIIAHGYFGLNRQVLWDIVQNGVPELLREVREILQNESEE